MPVAIAIPSSIVAEPKKIRGHSFVLPKWWMDEVRDRFDYLKARKEVTKVSLAAELTKAWGRGIKWDHKAVERFLDGTVTTLEMMWAFLRVWPSLLHPIFVAHTKRDAERITDELRGQESNPEWRNRYMELEGKLVEVAAPILDQTTALPSVNEGQTAARKPRSRGSRGMD